MSKVTEHPTEVNVPYRSGKGPLSGKPCKHRYHEVRRKDVADQTTLYNRCNLAASGTNKKCTHPDKTHKDCPRLK